MANAPHNDLNDDLFYTRNTVKNKSRRSAEKDPDVHSIEIAELKEPSTLQIKSIKSSTKERRATSFIVFNEYQAEHKIYTGTVSSQTTRRSESPPRAGEQAQASHSGTVSSSEGFSERRGSW
ncbi:MAG: hypothetical protein L6R37_005557 [Teloschistes peruensis]|nr:MAG: hypothetical protein L6R37_005557 [Teloschistes peruensis]